MALAKYLEDITERWLENTKARYEDRLKDLFAKFPPPPSTAGNVFLTRHGRRMEDIEVCEAGQELELNLVASKDAATPKLEVEVSGHWQEVPIRGHSIVLLPMQFPCQRQLRVVSAGYLKEYTLHVIEALRIDEQPDFARFIREMSDNPPNWTEATFGEFRREVEAILSSHGASRLFIDGVVEYHMGLFHEERRLPNFRDRLQSAYSHLRWFAPYSDIARLICIHYLYCANEFGAASALCGSGVTKMSDTLALFLGETHDPSTASLVSHQGLPLLVSLSDSLLFQAAKAIQEGRHEDAIELCAAVHRQTIPSFDRERAARLAYVDALARTKLGETESVQSRWETLAHSPWNAISAAAKHQLSLLPHV